MKHASIVPLIGGMTLGNEIAIGKPVEHLFSYEGFQGNEGYLRAYRPNVPYEVLGASSSQLTNHRHRYPFVSTTCPCSGLSLLSTGNAEARERANQWMWRVAHDVLGELQPDVFLGENAPQLITPMGRPVLAKLALVAEEYGYGFHAWKTVSLMAGIPQRRERCFYAFLKGGSVAPEALGDAVRAEASDTYVAAPEYLANVPGRDDDVSFPQMLTCDPLYLYAKERWGTRWRTGGGQNRDFPNLFEILETAEGAVDDFCAVYPEEPATYERLSSEHLMDQANRQTAAYQVKMVHRFKRNRLVGKGVYQKSPSFARRGLYYPAVTAKTMERLTHPIEDRYLTYREVAHLMAMPGDFKLPPVQLFNHVAQNVPVSTAAMASRVALRLLEDDRRTLGQISIYDDLIRWRPTFRATL